MKKMRPEGRDVHGNEMRHNPVSGQWVIYSLSRRKRPSDMAGARSERESRPDYDEQCPFCPGHERELPGIILECRGGESPWRLRVVENKFPALTPGGDLQRKRHGLYLCMQGYGHHEVVIESPVHNRQIPLMTQDEVEMIIEAYHRRYLDLMKLERNMLIVIFRNYGSGLGPLSLIPIPRSFPRASCRSMSGNRNTGPRDISTTGDTACTATCSKRSSPQASAS